MALSAMESIRIDALAAGIWATIRNFDALQDWHPAVAKSPADKANAEGSVRRLSLHGGGEVVETLERHDDSRMSYTYTSADGSALPVAGYRSTITVSPDGAGARVEWRGEFSAAPGVKDDAAVQGMRGVYRAGLDNLKRLHERG
ncbi:SRPBCC family protein [Piscinibacter sp. XHJ-5]|uniref:SRPBCC family protein n=1 Tax=Piscinibacter sp. XHJ-5 TaxID=3037797 RepID=UPI002452D0D4|nr:SRPBCC family protein [Piscinibacter sp. XHJ-5]